MFIDLTNNEIGKELEGLHPFGCCWRIAKRVIFLTTEVISFWAWSTNSPISVFSQRKRECREALATWFG